MANSTEYNKFKYYTTTVKVESNRLMVIDTNSVLTGTHIEAVWTRRATAGAKSLQGESLVNDANFESAFLILKKDTQTEVFKVPLWHIEKASLVEPHKGFPIEGKDLNFSSCQIEVAENVTLDTGKVFELTFKFFELKK